MKIGEVAKSSGLSAKTIRYYEQIGLLSTPARASSGYREYTEQDCRRLVFLRHARQVGFSTEACKQLLALYENPERRSQEVHALVRDKLKAIEQQVRELKSMKNILEKMSLQCANDEGAECAIINSLADTEMLEKNHV